VVRGDLTQIARDAWLLPSDRWVKVEEHWLSGEPLVAQLAAECGPLRQSFGRP
jgi:hypothetical protein